MGSLTLASVTARTVSINMDAINAGAAPDDWGVWNTGGLPPDQRRLGGGSTLSAVSLVAGGGPSTVNESIGTSWTNGTPTASGSSLGDFFNTSFSAGFGFSGTLPADTNLRTAWFLVGPYNTTNGTMVFSLSDGSATTVTDTTSLVATSGAFNPYLVIITYQANGTATLNYQFTSNGASTVTLQGIAVAKTGSTAAALYGSLKGPGPQLSPTKRFLAAPRSSAITASTAGPLSGTMISQSVAYGALAQLAVVGPGFMRQPGPGASPDFSRTFNVPPRSTQLQSASIATVNGLAISMSTAFGALAGSGSLSALSIAQSMVLGGALTGSGSLSALSLGQSIALGPLSGAGSLTGIGLGSSLALATPSGAGALAGISVAMSVAYGPLTALTSGTMQGIGIASSVAFGQLLAAGALTGRGLTLSEAYGALGGNASGALAGFSIAQSFAYGAMTGPGGGALSGLAQISSFGIGNMGATAIIAGRGISVSVTYGSLRGQPILIGGPRYIVGRAYLRNFTVDTVAKFRFPILEPAEEWPLTFNFANDLATGETLTSIVAVTITLAAGTDPNPTAIANGLAGIDPTNTQVIVPVKAGVLNCDYQILVTVATTNSLKELTCIGILPIRA
jgi:hypothetical protein